MDKNWVFRNGQWVKPEPTPEELQAAYAEKQRVIEEAVEKKLNELKELNRKQVEEARKKMEEARLLAEESNADLAEKVKNSEWTNVEQYVKWIDQETAFYRKKKAP